MKVVLDTNIWISGLLFPTSQAGKILNDWKASKFRVATSQFILDEIKRVLLYPKIAKRIQWDATKVDQYVTTLKFLTDFIIIEHFENDQKYSVDVPKDVNDIPILQTYLISQSEYLITGDSDLLDLKDQYAIMTLMEFYQICF